MTAPARLLAVRLHGFKSFAERTTVEFGPGISAVVGPNGSGKSNLADALRWALGEQGRSLRVRKAEEVIWAGSDRRAAQGMADVTIVLDNADGLLPVEFGVVELGRRLYRSGENDYLLNRQRVRLRDLVELLDAANLADNAFLFIGQGMVDQALSLRPEERRPLFDDVAGVSRHERRRKRAEAQLQESLVNLTRLEDILAELRPQVRRLAAQAAEQVSRRSVGEELVDALLASGHQRWHESAARQASAQAAFRRARSDADRAMAELVAADDRVTALTAQLEARADQEREARAALERLTGVRSAAELRNERLAAEAESIVRDQARLTEERQRLAAAAARERAVLAAPLPERDAALETALADAEQALAEATAELTNLRTVDRARDAEQAAIRRAEAARASEVETARRRVSEAERRLAAERAKAAAAGARLSGLEQTARDARASLDAAAAAEASAVRRRDEVRERHEAAEAAVVAAREVAEARSAALASRRMRLDSLRASLADEEADALAKAARTLGGRRLDEGLVVDPDLRPAVAAALAELARAWVVPRPLVASLGTAHGLLIVDDPAIGRDDTEARAPTEMPAVATVLEAVTLRGGGPLAAAIRRDPRGTVTRLLARAAWLPDLAACLEIQPSLPAGWILVPRDGVAVVGEMTVVLGPSNETLDRRAEIDTLGLEVERLEAQAAAAAAELEEAMTAAAAARAAFAAARHDETVASAERRRREELERRTSRDLEAALRESDWHRAQAARLEQDLAQLWTVLEGLQKDGTRPAAPAAGPSGASSDETTAGSAASTQHEAIAAWEARAASLRARRDGLAGQVAAVARARHEQELQRSRAEAGLALRDERLAAIDRELDTLAERARANQVAVAAVGQEVAEATAREAAARAAVEAIVAESTGDRDQLAAGERATAAARERVRVAEEAARAAERTSVEARLGLEGLREQLVADLGDLGDLAASRLPDVRSATGEEIDLEAVVDEVTRRWAEQPPPPELPGSGRVAALRRRYLELGAANPFAVEEHRELSERLESLEAQRSDLLVAIERTRRLIDELTGLISVQFRSTFEALEAAFDQRFRQLFGGGTARLELTDPSDPEGSGIDISARPPGKKRQALAMLSGGERSLTAVALLLAMLQVRPVPFCVLDEVDAALDEANVGRFTTALRELAEATQFVVITHNRGTIQAADALYGVTVGDNSVSRVISLRLDGTEPRLDGPRAAGAGLTARAD